MKNALTMALPALLGAAGAVLAMLWPSYHAAFCSGNLQMAIGG